MSKNRWEIYQDHLNDSDNPEITAISYLVNWKMGSYLRSQQTSVDGINNECGEDCIGSEDTSGTGRRNGESTYFV